MDQQLDLSFGLGDSAIDFDSEQEIVATSDVSLDENNLEQLENSQMDVNMEMVHENMMETDREIGNIEYSQDICSGNDMPILGGEEEVLSEQHQILEKVHVDYSDIVIQGVENEAHEICIPDVSNKHINIPIAQTLQHNISTPNLQTYRLASSSLQKPVSIAPKPAGLMSNKNYTNVVKKISLGNLQPRSGGIISADMSGRQVVVLPGGSGRLKLVSAGGANMGTVQNTAQLLRTPATQLVRIRQSTAPPLTKLSIKQDTVGTTNMATKNTQPRYLSIQEAQKLGLLTGGKIHQLLSVSPGKIGVANSTATPASISNIRPIRPVQTLSALKSPTKILPAPPQGAGSAGKVILTSATNPQSVVIRPNKSAQIMKADGPLTAGSTILANMAVGQKFNSQQIHQINIPGKGVQYVRLVTASSIGQQQSTVTQQSPMRITPIALAPAPLNSSATHSTSQANPIQSFTPKMVSAKPTQILPKRILIADYQSNLIHVGPNKPPALVTTSSMKKVAGKPQAKLLPVSFTPTLQKISQALPPFSISTPTSLHQVHTTNVTNQELGELPPEIIESNVHKVETVKHEMDDSNERGDGDLLENDQQCQSDEQENERSSPELNENIQSDTKHIVMVPASYIQQMQQHNGQNSSGKSLSIAANVEIKQEITEYPSKILDNSIELGLRPRKPCNCTKSQCLKLYCDCFANGEFCNQCNCNNCNNNLENEEYRQKAIRSCLERNPNAFRPKIGKAKNIQGPESIRRHNKGCNCKRSGCLKNYCECYEGKIACSANCKCIGCRNIEDCLDKKSLRRARTESVIGIGGSPVTENFNSSLTRTTSLVQNQSAHRLPPASIPTNNNNRPPPNIFTNEVIVAVCQCLLAQASTTETTEGIDSPNIAKLVLEEFSHCLQEIIATSQQVQHKHSSDNLTE